MPPLGACVATASAARPQAAPPAAQATAGPLLVGTQEE